MATIVPAPPVSGVTFDQFMADSRYGEYDELILGIVWEAMPEGWDHFLRTLALEKVFKAIHPDGLVAREAPLTIPGQAQLRPDVTVYRESFEAYAVRPATSGDALIVLEVSVSTHDRDLGPKDVQYARAGIPEYVIVDLKNRSVEVRTDPTPKGYLRREPLFPGDAYRGVAVEELLGPEPSKSPAIEP